MAELRPLIEASGGTCDWGACNEVAVEERHDAEHGWLPVCERHTGRRERRPSPGRATCGHCGKEYALSTEGRMRKHDRGFAQRCPGSGAEPATVPP